MQNRRSTIALRARLRGYRLACALLLWVAGVRAAAPVPQTLYTTEHEAMAATWTLYLYAPTPQAAAQASDAVFDEVDRIEQLLSNYRSTSELSRINQLAATETVTTDPETFRFLTEAQHWSSASDGAFDLTVGALMKGWGFFRKSGTVPTAEQFQTLRAQTGWQKLQLDPGTRGVRFLSAGVELDPGGIGKGFAVDAALKILRDAGVQRAMVSAGSSTLGALDAPPGTPGWPVHLHDPWNPGRHISTVFLHNGTLSTANCAEKNFTLSGHRYCHIMDPRTLRPVEGKLQVTILDPSGTASDALSNVLFVQTRRQSRYLLQTLPLDRALIVTGDAEHRTCTAIRWPSTLASDFCKRAE